MMDTNIDTSENRSKNSKYKPKLLKNLEENLMKNKLEILNKELTRFQQGVSPSCIDHIITNNSARMMKTQTLTNGLSDHETVTSEYHNSKMIMKRAERIVRNSKNLTVENLEKDFDENEKLSSIHQEEDPDEIAKTIQEEL